MQALRVKVRKLLPAWPFGVYCVIIAGFFAQLMTEISTGALFSTYLLELRGSNTFIGTVESARGVWTPPCALLVAWMVDKFPKTRLLRWNLLVGLFSILQLFIGIRSDSIPFIIAGILGLVLHNQCFLGVQPVLLAEMIWGRERVRVLGFCAMLNNLGSAAALLLQLSLIVFSGTTQWSLVQLRWILCVGLVSFIPYAAFTWLISLPERVGALGINVELNGDSRGETAGHAVSSGLGVTPHEPVALTPRRRLHISGLTITSLWITSFGAGLFFKYWPLFFKDIGFSPMGVCLMQICICCAMSLSNGLSPFLAELIGRGLAFVFFHCGSTTLLFVVSWARSTVVLVPAVLGRNFLMHGTEPLSTSLLLDVVPSLHRGKVLIMTASVGGMLWSGGAFFGGGLDDAHGYHYTFFIGACVHSVAAFGIILVALVANAAGLGGKADLSLAVGSSERSDAIPESELCRRECG